MPICGDFTLLLTQCLLLFAAAPLKKKRIHNGNWFGAMILGIPVYRILQNGIMMSVVMVGEIMSCNFIQNKDWKMQEWKKDTLLLKQEKNHGRGKTTRPHD